MSATMSQVTDALEKAIREAHDRGQLHDAATLALEGYGREVLSFLVATMRDPAVASDVFGQTCEDMWKGWADFGWRCTCRTWLYRLARNAAFRHRRSPINQKKRRVPLSQITEVADRIRTQTLPHLRTEVKDDFDELRRALDPEDQALLILRVNRRLSWNDIARIVDGAEEEADLSRSAARLRQRYQKIKRDMRKLAQERGLLDRAPE